MIHWQTDSAALGPQAQSAFASLDSTFALEGEVLANSRVSRVIRVQLDGRHYYVKRYLGAIKNAWRERLGTTRIEGEWENLRRFAQWGIPTPQIVASGFERRHRRFLRGAMITAGIAHTQDLATLALADDARLHDAHWVRTVAGQVARDTRIMHSHGFAHNDLKWRNILVNDTQPPQTFWIDCPTGTFWWGPFLRYRIIKDLACLDKLACKHLRRSQRLRFYLDYAGRTRLSDSDKRRVRRIVGFFEGRE